MIEKKTAARSEYTLTAIQAALKAGALLRRGFGTNYQIFSKGRHDHVTEYDKASEKIVIDTILEKFPSHAILAEESGASHPENSGQPLWIIDPLDGTTNFSRRIPIFNVSIAAYVDKELISGVVYQPITDELFVAEKGNGAYLNGTRLQVSTTSAFADLFVGLGFPMSVKATIDFLTPLSEMVRQSNPIREIGSAALNLAYLAAGSFDAYWIGALHPWDAAAGQLLIEEAGGRVTHQDGTPYALFSRGPLLATNGKMHKELVNFLGDPLSIAK